MRKAIDEMKTEIERRIKPNIYSYANYQSPKDVWNKINGVETNVLKKVSLHNQIIELLPHLINAQKIIFDVKISH